MHRGQKNTGDLTPQVDLHHANRTGPDRTHRPLYVDLLPPCNHACPAGENIQEWLSHTRAGQLKKAWETIMRDNPLPAVHGRVCYHPCQDQCNRLHVDETVNIHAIERFVGDEALEKGWRVSPNKNPNPKKILIVGAGPSGLSAAYHLAMLGHAVEIRDAGPFAGGMMHFGIPKYRLPREILEAEVDRISALGVAMILNHPVKNLMAEFEGGRFDAAFLAIGAHISRQVEIPGQDAGKIIDALSFLRDVEAGARPQIGRRVAVYGGGNTALDAARTAKRLGAAEAFIIYRRDRRRAPAHEFEIDEAEEEGIKIHWLRTIKQMGPEQFIVEKMILNERGLPEPTGQFERLEADSLILALGQKIDSDFLKDVPGLNVDPDGIIAVDQQLMTGHPGLFAGGDMISNQRSVAIAVGHGKQAARCIAAYLQGRVYKKSPKKPLAAFERLHFWYQTDAEAARQRQLDPAQRTRSFAEISQGMTREEALYEATRCLSCGNCFECDGCYGACPEQAIIKLGPGKRYQFNYDQCTGCAACYEQCPCAAIEMIDERSAHHETAR